MELDPTALSHLYRWIDTIPLDRPKKNIARDFSDGVLMSQVLHYFFPKLVELHNYSASNSVDQKNYNWKTLNQKVFKRMGFMISPVDIEAVVSCKKHAIERVLLLIQAKIGEYQQVLASGPQEPDVPAVPSPKAVPAKKQPQAAPPARQQAPPQQQQQHQSPPRKAAPQQPQQQAPQAGNGKQQQQSSGPVSKDTQIHELQETVDILQLKVQKLEQLLRLKNSKIDSLTKKMAELTGGQ